MGAVRQAQGAMNAAADAYHFPPTTNRRGTHRSITAGISYGGGQRVSLVRTDLPNVADRILQEVRNLSHGKNGPVVEELLANPGVQRLAGFMDSTSMVFVS